MEWEVDQIFPKIHLLLLNYTVYDYGNEPHQQVTPIHKDINLYQRARVIQRKRKSFTPLDKQFTAQL